MSSEMIHSRRNMKLRHLIPFLLFALSCTASRTLLISDTYDVEKDMTTFSMLPYEIIKIPGRWTKTEFRPSSNQQFFIGPDSTKLIIGFTSYDRYEFSKPTLVGFDFVQQLYEWDSKYLAEQAKAERKIISSNKDKPYILYNLKNNGLNKYLLYGYKNKVVYSFIIDSNKLNEEEMIRFLESLYLSVY